MKYKNLLAGLILIYLVCAGKAVQAQSEASSEASSESGGVPFVMTGTTPLQKTDGRADKIYVGPGRYGSVRVLRPEIREYYWPPARHHK